MKKLLLLISIAIPLSAAELNDLAIVVPNQVSSAMPGNTITPFTPQKLKVPEQILSSDVASIIENAKKVIAEENCTKQKIQKAKNACLRSLKKTTSPYERAKLAEAYATL